MDDLGDLLVEIAASYETDTRIGDYEAYDLYLMGMIARRQGNTAGATDYLVAALKSNSSIWGAWIELAFLIMDRSAVSSATYEIQLVSWYLPMIWEICLNMIYVEYGSCRKWKMLYPKAG